MAKKSKAAGVISVLETLLLVVLLVLCAALTVPRLLGYSMYHIVSPSMEPAIPVGSLVYCSRVEPGTLESGDIAVFYSAVDSGAVITHRVVKNKTVSGEIVTKGDANEAEDPLPVTYDRVIGKVVLTIPYMGKAASFTSLKEGKIAIGSAIALVVVLQLTADALRKKARKKEELKEESKEEL